MFMKIKEPALAGDRYRTANGSEWVKGATFAVGFLRQSPSSLTLLWLYKTNTIRTSAEKLVWET